MHGARISFTQSREISPEFVGELDSTIVGVAKNATGMSTWERPTKQWRQREFKVGGTSLVSRLSAYLTEANWWRLIAE